MNVYVIMIKINENPFENAKREKQFLLVIKIFRVCFICYPLGTQTKWVEFSQLLIDLIVTMFGKNTFPLQIRIIRP